MGEKSSLSIEERKQELIERLRGLIGKTGPGNVIEVKIELENFVSLKIDYDEKLFGIPVNGFFMYKELLLLAVGVGDGCSRAKHGSLWVLQEDKAGIMFCGGNLAVDFKKEGYEIV